MKRMTFEEFLAAVLVMLMVSLVTLQVLSRYVLHISLSHTEELVRYLFVWATFIGASGAVYRNRHLSVTGTAPESRFRKHVSLLSGIGAVLFSCLLIARGISVVMLQARTGQKTAAMGLPMWIIGLAVPLGAAFMLVRILQRAVPGQKGAR